MVVVVVGGGDNLAIIPYRTEQLPNTVLIVYLVEIRNVCTEWGQKDNASELKLFGDSLRIEKWF